MKCGLAVGRLRNESNKYESIIFHSSTVDDLAWIFDL